MPAPVPPRSRLPVFLPTYVESSKDAPCVFVTGNMAGRGFRTISPPVESLISRPGEPIPNWRSSHSTAAHCPFEASWSVGSSWGEPPRTGIHACVSSLQTHMEADQATGTFVQDKRPLAPLYRTTGHWHLCTGKKTTGTSVQDKRPLAPLYRTTDHWPGVCAATSIELRPQFSSWVCWASTASTQFSVMCLPSWEPTAKVAT
eukprot:366040-Chlamydomonas_euryale.AAC.7